MQIESDKTVTQPLTDRQFMCDDDLLRFLMDERGRSISEIASHFHVTATAIRNRLTRLTAAQSVTQNRDAVMGRGRPRLRYFITSEGAASIGERTS
jgi:predicted ArsR family transcriptional regulator